MTNHLLCVIMISCRDTACRVRKFLSTGHGTPCPYKIKGESLLLKLTDINTLRDLLTRHGIILSKGMGQNFLINPSICPRMAQAAGIDESTGVIEIGPGVGVLTLELAKLAGRVIAIELDERLRPVLSETLGDFDHIDVIFGDVLRLNLHQIIKEKLAGFDRIVVCANLPYYITSPIVMGLLENRLPIDSITVMVQREAAERMCAAVGSRESGAVTVAVNFYSNPGILFRVSPGSFLPPPKVESAVMRLDVIKDLPDVPEEAEKAFWALVKAGFGQRRKTLCNAAGNAFGKERVLAALESAGLPSTARIEQLSMAQLWDVSRRLVV